MPNHIHVIIARTRHDVSPQQRQQYDQIPQYKNDFGPQKPGSIPIIIGQFKSSVTRWCNKNQHEYFKWQNRYHDRIIRNDYEYNRIADYILNNPYNWK